MNVPILQDNIKTTIQNSPFPVVVDFFASWCSKCSMMDSIYNNIAQKHHMRIDFYKVDIEISKEYAEELGIEITPTFVVYEQGEILGYTTGVLSQSVLEKRILALVNQK